MSATAGKATVERGGHAVHFYTDDAELGTLVSDHLATALAEEVNVVAIATEPHIRRFEAGLAASGIDLEEARSSGRLVFLDAATALEDLIVDGTINREAFQRVIGDTVRQLGQGARPVCAYGEMVDLLWQSGDITGAIDLEVLWNELIEELQFSLLCAYHSEAAATPEHQHALHEVCRLHSSVSGAAGLGRQAARELSRDYKPASEAPRQARRFIEDALRRWGHSDAQLQDARLLLSELVTNAVTHAGSPFSVSLRSEGSRVRLAVRDGSRTEPQMRPVVHEAESGRGLQIVGALSTDWGVIRTPAGKTVWAEL